MSSLSQHVRVPRHDTAREVGRRLLTASVLPAIYGGQSDTRAGPPPLSTLVVPSPLLSSEYSILICHWAGSTSTL